MIQKILSDTRIPVKIWASIIEPEAEEQVKKVANLPFIESHVAVMPDVHAGRGSTIGTVIATRGAIIPSCVGVDIGCGMSALSLPFKIDRLGGDERLRELRHSIERAVPTGRHGRKEAAPVVVAQIKSLGELKMKLEERVFNNSLLQVGSLGGGNHFIELCRDQNDDAWIMLHSGSRNIGKTLADRHIDVAKGLMKQYFIDLPDPDLSYLAQGTPEFDAYISDLNWAQGYAKYNRFHMMHSVSEQVYRHVFGVEWELEFENLKSRLHIDCHHNYTQLENHFGKNLYVTRKGAVSAYKGEFGIIPGSMGAKSFIVRGKGNEESFCSCAHGAGRMMSRTKARATFTAKDLEDQTFGVECPKTVGFVDEIPSAYKDIDVVMNDQADLVDVVYTLKQVLCVKGST